MTLMITAFHFVSLCTDVKNFKKYLYVKFVALLLLLLNKH